jgi:hypothetical protein
LHLSHKKVGRNFVELLRKCIGSLTVGVYDLVCSRRKRSGRVAGSTSQI